MRARIPRPIGADLSTGLNRQVGQIQFHSRVVTVIRIPVPTADQFQRCAVPDGNAGE